MTRLSLLQALYMSSHEFQVLPLPLLAISALVFLPMYHLLSLVRKYEKTLTNVRKSDIIKMLTIIISRGLQNRRKFFRVFVLYLYYIRKHEKSQRLFCRILEIFFEV